MKKVFTVFFIAIAACFLPVVLAAQSKLTLPIDTSVISKKLPGDLLKDSTRFKQPVNKLKTAARDKSAAFAKELSKLKKGGVSADLILENKNQYNPLPVIGAPIARNGLVTQLNVIGTLQVFGVPININYSTNRAASLGQQGFNNNLFKFDFDPKQLKGMFQNDLEQYYDLRRRVFSGMDLTQYTRQMLTEQLKTQVIQQKDVLTGYAKENKLNAYLNDPQKLSQLLRLDEQQIRQKLMAEVGSADSSGKITSQVSILEAGAGTRKDSLSAKITQQTGSLTALLNKTTPGDSIRMRSRAKIDSISRLVSSVRAQLQKKGYDVNKMLDVQQYLDGAAGQGPSEAVSAFMKNRAQSGIQSFFTHIREFKLGSFGENIPGNSKGKDAFVSGSHVTFITNHYPITLGYGATSDLGTFKDAGFQQSVFTAPKSLSYISTEFKRGVFGHVKISVIGSVNRQVDNIAYTTPTLSSNNVAITVNRTLNLGKLGKASLDLSKSTTIYNNNYRFNAEDILDKKAGLNDKFALGFSEAFAFGINHNIELEKSGFSENVYFQYSGMGYQNPGDNGYGGAKRKLGGNLKKYFYHNKLIVNLRTGLTNMPVSYTSNDQWKTFQVQLDTRYAINRKFNVSLKYNTNGTDKQVNNQVTPVYSFQKMQFDGNASLKLGRYLSVSHFTAGVQKFSNSYASSSAGNLLMLNYIQSITLQKNTLSASVFYNKELSGYQLIGNMFNSDLSYQYSLFNKINLSTAATYLSNGSIARQCGVRQGIQLYAGSHFDIDSYIDLRKNLITPLYADLYANCRAELSLRYHLKN